MDKRLKLLKELVKFSRLCGEKGLVIAGGGNISARIGETIYIKRQGAFLGRALSRDFIPVTLREGRQGVCFNKKPSKEFYMHAACFKTRPDIRAVLHTHPVFATVMANARVSIKKPSYELMSVMDSAVPCVKHFKPGTERLAEEVSKKIKNANGLFLSNHGIVTVGKSPEEAFNRSVALERASCVYILTGLAKRLKA